MKGNHKKDVQLGGTLSEFLPPKLDWTKNELRSPMRIASKRTWAPYLLWAARNKNQLEGASLRTSLPVSLCLGNSRNLLSSDFCEFQVGFQETSCHPSISLVVASRRCVQQWTPLLVLKSKVENTHIFCNKKRGGSGLPVLYSHPPAKSGFGQAATRCLSAISFFTCRLVSFTNGHR